MPIDRFHVPALVLGGLVEPAKIRRLASQIDLIPTLLGLMGIDSPLPAIGLDLLRPDIDAIPGRAIMQYHDTQAYMEENNVVIMKLGQPPEAVRAHSFRVNACCRAEPESDQAWSGYCHMDHLRLPKSALLFTRPAVKAAL